MVSFIIVILSLSIPLIVYLIFILIQCIKYDDNEPEEFMENSPPKLINDVSGDLNSDAFGDLVRDTSGDLNSDASGEFTDVYSDLNE
jgi:hypothetical protein